VDFFFFPTAVERLALQAEFDQVLEVLGGGVAGPGLPADDGLARNTEEFGEPGLGQIAGGAEGEDLLAETIVPVAV
jgi:hypothetical protein